MVHSGCGACVVLCNYFPKPYGTFPGEIIPVVMQLLMLWEPMHVLVAASLLLECTLRDISLSPASLVISLLPLGLTEAHWCPWPMRNFIHYVSQQSCIANIYKLQHTDHFYYGIFYMVLFFYYGIIDGFN